MFIVKSDTSGFERNMWSPIHLQYGKKSCNLDLAWRNIRQPYDVTTIEYVKEWMNDHFEDIVCDVGEENFGIAHFTTTFCSLDYTLN